MKTFKQHLLEVRRNPEQNPHISIYKALEPYKDDPDMFITFTEINKVGINPQSGYNTPVGVYTYPLKEAWSLYANAKLEKLTVPFAANSPYVSLLRRKGKYIDDIGVTYNSSDFDEDIDKLYKIGINYLSSLRFSGFSETTLSESKKKNIAFNILKPIFQKAIDNASFNAIGGKIWNIIRVLSLLIGSCTVIEFSKLPGHTGNFFSEINLHGSVVYYKLMTLANTTLDTFDINDKKLHFSITTYTDGKYVANLPSSWTNLWLQLGYQSVGDRSGVGIIHEAEPTQCVFFSKAGYDVIGTFDNKASKIKDRLNIISAGADKFQIYSKDIIYVDYYEAQEVCKKLGSRWRMPTEHEMELMLRHKILKRNSYWISTTQELLNTKPLFFITDFIEKDKYQIYNSASDKKSAVIPVRSI